jgi:hypothetical protein
MLVMARFRAFTNEFKLTARTVQPLYDAVDGLVRRYRHDKTMRFRSRKLGAEAVINVAAWYFADLDPARQDQILRTYLPRLESYLAVTDSPAEAGAAPPPADGSTGRPLDPASGMPLEPPPGRRRKGSA